MQALNTIRPPDNESSDAHWCASSSAGRNGVEAKQAAPIRTREVTPATAAISESASNRGFASSESPTHTPSHRASASACRARSSIDSTVVPPVTTPRLESVNPSFTAIRHLPPAG